LPDFQETFWGKCNYLPNIICFQTGTKLCLGYTWCMWFKYHWNLLSKSGTRRSIKHYFCIYFGLWCWNSRCSLWKWHFGNLCYLRVCVRSWDSLNYQFQRQWDRNEQARILESRAILAWKRGQNDRSWICEYICRK